MQKIIITVKSEPGDGLGTEQQETFLSAESADVALLTSEQHLSEGTHDHQQVSTIKSNDASCKTVSPFLKLR